MNINATLVNIEGTLDYRLRHENGAELHTYTVRWAEPQPGMALRIEWSAPIIDIQYQWHATIGMNRSLIADWSRGQVSRIASGSPLHSFYNDAGINRMTVALDDGVTPIERNLGVHEEDGTLTCRVNIPLDTTGRTHSYEVTLRIDTSDRRWEDAIRDVACWWERKYPPMNVPAEAYAPLYSCWYSFHQQVIAAEVEAECVRAADMGMRTVIVDDGWQTGDNNRGYAYCGDWQVCPEKIPDMAAHVKKVHEAGLKYMLWYSVPFIGMHSKAAKQFEGKTLEFDPGMGAYTLDPRYPEVREYLIGVYARALTDWDLDGFKLDFIDSFRMKETTPAYAEGMDVASLEEAVHTLMVDVMRTLTGIKPGILIEFRQSYIGPVMREFGNMLRVGDCPNSTILNRVGMVDLRLTSGNTAVHSDMLMWNSGDRVENAVMQIQNAVFATVQLSVKLDDIPEDHKKALRFWTDFMAENVDILQRAPIYAEQPQNLYPVVYTVSGGRSVIACYSAEHAVSLPDGAEDVYVLNANSGERLIICADGGFDAEIFDCTGEKQGAAAVSGPVACVPVSPAGFVRIRRR